jgi:hypothetical protein
MPRIPKAVISPDIYSTKHSRTKHYVLYVINKLKKSLMIFKTIIKGLFLFCVIITVVIWCAWILASIYRGYNPAVVFDSILMGTLCLLLWLMIRHNENLIEEKNYWKQQYNELVGRIFKGDFYKGKQNESKKEE